MKVMKLLKEEECCQPTTPTERRVRTLRTRYGWRPRMPPLIVRVKVNVKGNSDSPIRNPDVPNAPKVGVYVSPVTGRSYPCMVERRVR